MREPGICDQCEKEGLVEYCLDPYLDELHSEDDWSYWCEECWDRRKADV